MDSQAILAFVESGAKGVLCLAKKIARMQFESVIGLEIHVELATKTKLFCGCPNGFGGEPNSQVCPVCLGLPGVLPVVNKEAVALLLRAGIALNCKVPPRSKFDRKNYFYPDMPKNYQISQYDLPLTVDGELGIFSDGDLKTVGIERIHLEEDTGKSIHVAPKNVAEARQGVIIGGRIGESEYTLVDYNRAGVPLIEIVTRPDMRFPQEAVEFLQKLRLTLQTIGVSDCKMEEGRMRCDANVSLMPAGSQKFGVKVEIKNMNSFKSVRDALSYEIERQKQVLSKGETLSQETRAWDEDKKITFTMRSKEEAHDYRYFPEPDLPPFEIRKEWVDEIKASLPELPDAKQRRYQEEHQLSREDAELLVSSLALSKFFDETMKISANSREACNWLRGDVSRYLKEKGIEISDTRLSPLHLANLIGLIEKGIISGKIAKEILPEILEKGENPETLVQKRGLVQISDEKELGLVVASILSESSSAGAIEEYRKGNERAIAFLVGAVMKKTKGKANPQLVNRLLKESLESLKIK